MVVVGDGRRTVTVASRLGHVTGMLCPSVLAAAVVKLNGADRPRVGLGPASVTAASHAGYGALRLA